MAISRSFFLRVFSSLVLIPIVLGALFWGGVSFWALTIVVYALSLYEWHKMARVSLRPILILCAGIFYITICFSSIFWIREGFVSGPGAIVALFLSVWASDSGAYFAGKAFGGAKMAPKISPNKTWAGFFGGMVASVAALLTYALFIDSWFSGLVGINLEFPELRGGAVFLPSLGAMITISGQGGDLLISRLKRAVGFKDTGTLIPGHGGILDRIDSLLLAGLFLFVSLSLLVVDGRSGL